MLHESRVTSDVDRLTQMRVNFHMKVMRIENKPHKGEAGDILDPLKQEKIDISLYLIFNYLNYFYLSL